MSITADDGAEAPKPKLLIPFALGHCANDLAPVAMYLIIPAFGLAYGLTPVEIGLLFTIHALGASLAYLPAGILSDHVARRGLLLLATFFWVGLGYFFAGFATDFWTFAILITLAGAGDAAWHPMATGILTGIHKERRAYALGVHAIGGHMAEILALVATGYLLTYLDWGSSLQLLTIPALAMGVAFLFIQARVPRSGEKMGRADFAEIWRAWIAPSGLRIVALFVTYNMAVFAMLTMTPVYLQNDHGFGWQSTALALAAMMVLGVLAQPAMGRVSDVIGRRPVLVLGNLIAALAAAAAWLAPSLILVLLALGLALTVLVAVRAVMLAVAVDYAGKREGTNLGLAFVFMDGVGALAAVLAGAVGEYDLRYAFLLAGVFSAVATVLALIALQPRLGRLA
ncbi:MAG: MFS transporter [Kiloniellales bacterium]